MRKFFEEENLPWKTRNYKVLALLRLILERRFRLKECMAKFKMRV